MKTQIPDAYLDLVNGPPIAALTTVMPDGQPQTTVIWCNFDGRHVLVNTMRGFRKEKNMRLNPKVTLLCYDPPCLVGSCGTRNSVRSTHHKPMIHGLIEVDVSRARAYLREHQAKTGEALSFTAFIMTCLAKAVDEHKAVQAMRLGSKRIILFDEVDVLTYIERDVAGQQQIMPYIIRAANRKTFREIHQEIRAAQGEDVAKTLKGFKAFQFLPILLLSFLFWMLGRYPQVLKKYWGTVTMTAVGMFGKGAGWSIPIAGTLMLTVGGIGEKPGVVDGHIALRDYLSLTISFDHDSIDGAPAARFTQRLKDLIESSYGLPDATVELEQAGAK